MTGVKANPRSGAALRLLEVTVRGTVIVVLTAICSPPGRVHFLFRPVTKGTAGRKSAECMGQKWPEVPRGKRHPGGMLEFYP